MDAMVLPAELVEAQLAAIDLIAAMYPSPGEVEVSESTTECIASLREWCLDPTSAPVSLQIPSSISVTVRLPIADEGKSIQVHISFPLRSTGGQESADQLPPIGYSLRQPEWMSKAEVAALSAAIPTEDTLEAFDYIQAEGARFLETKRRQAMSSREGGETDAQGRRTGPLVRVWFYFPSLSTRKKRDDMVHLAPGYALTGFVLAGKPGVLCLEGQSGDIDAYMSFIKTHSWGDIPSHQKKVSERFRETEDVQRVFPGMEEITDSLGERGGQRANRGDMQALEAWLGSKGLQHAFEKVIF
ncbi:hypothetical protein PDE_04895 [Penicillium oxalicum 114-2]|uniref:Small nuclear ribonucleoprotein Prp3 C-terminal domain-containing protein n=1 Tax=Penicillium oxalicum (strain 114-2 / CGMCC 5302) TaxID=933388 RepID=S7ZH01_PENO1|nr:hypothetical protein PDE_04895 [Penicillium oxalicum 114-2]